jgi:calcium permeable stress-gated cation channel
VSLEIPNLVFLSLMTLFDRLEQPWIYEDQPPVPQDESDESLPGEEQPILNPPSSESSFSLGDTHIWRDNQENMV